MDQRSDAAPTGYGRRWSNGAARPTDAGLMDGRAQPPLLVEDGILPSSLLSIHETNRMHGIADEESWRMESMANEFYRNIAYDQIIMQRTKETKATAKTMERQIAERNAQRGQDKETMEETMRDTYEQQQAKLVLFKKGRDHGTAICS